jgi:predicted ATPase
MITQLYLKNFKSIGEVNLALRPLNVLIGRNAAGKSNLLSFFSLLREAANANLNQALNRMGGIGQVAHYNASEFEWAITFDSFESSLNSTVTYVGKVAARLNGYRLRFESLERPPYEGYETPYRFMDVRDGRIRLLTQLKGAGNEEQNFEESDQELVIAQIRDRVRYPALYEVRATLADWSIFRGFGSEALETIRKPQLLNVVEPPRLDASGANLISVLQQLANQPQYDDHYAALMEVLQAAFDDLERFDIPIVAGGMGALNYRSRHFRNAVIPALNMSDGQLRFLGLALLLTAPNPPPLIAIDEPELGLHPHLLGLLAELLREAAKHTQIIVTTHAPQLVNALQPEDILLVERETAYTTLTRPDGERLAKWLERYTLGELWTMGRLGA